MNDGDLAVYVFLVCKLCCYLFCRSITHFRYFY